jgi:hypothetical protein
MTVPSVVSPLGRREEHYVNDTITPASAEVIEYTLTEHRRGCPDFETRCLIRPCDSALVVYCVLRRAVVAGFEPDRPLCEHGRVLAYEQRYGSRDLHSIDGWHDPR